MKLELTNDTKIAIWKIGNAALMCQDNDITSAKYEEISLEAMNEANGAHLKNSNCNIPLVSNCAYSCSYKEVKDIWNAAEKHVLHGMGEVCKGDVNYEEDTLDLNTYYERHYY